MFPFQSIKTVRLRLNLTKALVEDHSLNVKVLLLVRDPRGTIQSRKHRVRVMWWGVRQYICITRTGAQVTLTVRTLPCCVLTWCLTTRLSSSSASSSLVDTSKEAVLPAQLVS